MKRILWWTLVAPLGFLALCAIVLFLFKEKTRHDLDAYKSGLIAKGETLDLSVLSHHYPTQIDEPVRQLLADCERVSNFLRSTNFPDPLPDKLKKDGSLPAVSFSDTARYRNMRERSDSNDRLPWDEITKQFEPCGKLLAPIRDRVRKENLEFHPDYSVGVDLKMSYLTWLNDTVRLFLGDALIQLKNGNVARAIEDAEAVLRIGRILQKQPIDICQISAFWSYRDAAGLTWQIIHSRSANDPQLLALQQSWQAVDALADMAPTIRMDSAQTVSHFSDPDRLLGFYLGDIPPYQVNISKLKPLDQAKALGAFAAWRWVLLHIDEHRSLEALQEALGAIEDIRTSKNLPKLHSESRRISNEVRYAPLLIFSSSTSSTFSVVTRGIEAQAIVNLTVTALALERYRLANAGYPTSLEELVPDYLGEIPKDPYDNSPLRYRKNPERFVLYSIGNDLTDNNTDKGYDYSYSNKPFERSPDIVWPLPSMTPNDTAERPRIVPKKFVRRIAAPTPTPAQRSPQNTP